MASYRQAVALLPGHANAVNNLGNVCTRLGRVDEAIGWFRRAIEIDPSSTMYSSNLLYYLHFDPSYDASAILREHLDWKRRQADPYRTAAPRSWDNERSTDRRLRIGYVSPHFKDHCVSMFTLPLLAHHDRGSFEIFCYANVTAADPLTERLRGLVDAWRDIAPLSDEQAAEVIGRDRIDILIDLTLHMGGNRLLIFARKPAPVQVTWLGYPGTTGLDTVDYRLTDPHLDPPGEHDDFYVERSIRLPETFWCYDPAALDGDHAPDVGSPPCVATGHITFGSLNNLAKVNDQVLALWARVLSAAPPSARFLLLSPPGEVRERIAAKLMGRVDFIDRLPRRQYLETYRRIDVALDTFPANGHTTSMDALWMGVPVVTLPGQTAISRGGLSLLANLGLDELVARSADQFVRTAVELATDLPRLRELRATLRPRLIASPIMDANRFARKLEEAYRSMWKSYVSSNQ
jgi:predicted O-linked N-acetylglucosamine transferase (SPINDLY family)